MNVYSSLSLSLCLQHTGSANCPICDSTPKSVGNFPWSTYRWAKVTTTSFVLFVYFQQLKTDKPRKSFLLYEPFLVLFNLIQKTWNITFVTSLFVPFFIVYFILFFVFFDFSKDFAYSTLFIVVTGSQRSVGLCLSVVWCFRPPALWLRNDIAVLKAMMHRFILATVSLCQG